MSSKTGKKPNGAKHVSKVVDHVTGTATAQRVKWAKPAVALSSKSSWLASLSAYQEKSAVKFRSDADMNAFIDLVWSDPDLRGMPHAPVGDNTVIVPSVAQNVIARKFSGKCSVTTVIDPRNLSQHDFAELRKERDTVQP